MKKKQKEERKNRKWSIPIPKSCFLSRNKFLWSLLLMVVLKQACMKYVLPHSWWSLSFAICLYRSIGPNHRMYNVTLFVCGYKFFLSLTRSVTIQSAIVKHWRQSLPNVNSKTMKRKEKKIKIQCTNIRFKHNPNDHQDFAVAFSIS